MKLHKLNKTELTFENVTGKVYTYFILTSLCFVGIIIYLIFNPIKHFTHTKEVNYVDVQNYDHIKYSFLFDKMKIKNKKAFVYEVKAIAERTGIPYEHILGVFNSESIGIDPKAKNPSGNAFGLFQITPIAAKELGISQEALYKSDEYQQLIWFEKYLNYWGVENIKNYGDLYCMVYLPGWMNNDEKEIPQYILNANPAYKNCKSIKDFKLYVTENFNKLK